MIRPFQCALLVIGITLLVACTPEDEQYCKNMGVTGTTEYGNCISYYNTQDQAFRMDRAACDAAADMTYPQSLYDRGRSDPILVMDEGVDKKGRRRSHTEYISTPPDDAHNAQLDQLRMRIIAPCMMDHGWNSADTWQGGRHPVAAPQLVPSAPATPTLPWAR